MTSPIHLQLSKIPAPKYLGPYLFIAIHVYGRRLQTVSAKVDHDIFP